MRQMGFGPGLAPDLQSRFICFILFLFIFQRANVEIVFRFPVPCGAKRKKRVGPDSETAGKGQRLGLDK